ncbi:hypothetical protein [Blastochloris viridis]|uniref:Uncharacterized protein n=2 Tax=Blastochloris viridis TaxID=1079 RepID=A0A0H5BNU2_BLAVI|nr:hypothetical protein [Blastochloris viridis]ALK08483.1 hypothetical protein BVIR_689 [Blastochloris viridis]BAR98233.1 hypothetical protein BV133_640 [Blastochloris viridis]CUU41145.1 hypothetical protein BVIRIDIS_01330 [Blastochloris viridis]
MGIGVGLAAVLVVAGCGGPSPLASEAVGAQPVPPSALVSAEGTCADAPEGAAAPAKLDFGLTECDVLRLVGPVDRVEVGDTHGVRVVTMTSFAGARPGVYRFEAGRLKSLEAMPEPEKKKGKPAARH